MCDWSIIHRTIQLPNCHQTIKEGKHNFPSIPRVHARINELVVKRWKYINYKPRCTLFIVAQLAGNWEHCGDTMQQPTTNGMQTNHMNT
jgi:hypothetical protein